jgi:amino acid transporter
MKYYNLRVWISAIMVIVALWLFVLSLISLENHKYEAMIYYLFSSTSLALIVAYLEDK